MTVCESSSTPIAVWCTMKIVLCSIEPGAGFGYPSRGRGKEIKPAKSRRKVMGGGKQRERETEREQRLNVSEKRRQKGKQMCRERGREKPQ